MSGAPTHRLHDACCAHADLSSDCTSPLPHYPSHDSCNSGISPTTEVDHFTRNFDCNVCMQVCRDPVVTFCGHLFCWPCLYSYLSLHPAASKECPVCTSDVQDKIVPLYGCGMIGSNSTEASHGANIPSRPSVIPHNINYQDKLNHAIQQHNPHPSAHSGLSASLRRFGLTSLSPHGGMLGRAAALLMRRRRFNNEKEFAAHWLFIVVASATSIALFLAS